MPVGAISNPVKVPGGLAIVTLQGKREIGRDIATVLSVRQVFLPFTTPLNPTEPDRGSNARTLDKARHISATVRGCAQMEEVAKKDHSPRPADPGADAAGSGAPGGVPADAGRACRSAVRPSRW